MNRMYISIAQSGAHVCASRGFADCAVGASERPPVCLVSGNAPQRGSKPLNCSRISCTFAYIALLLSVMHMSVGMTHEE